MNKDHHASRTVAYFPTIKGQDRPYPRGYDDLQKVPLYTKSSDRIQYYDRCYLGKHFPFFQGLVCSVLCCTELSSPVPSVHMWCGEDILSLSVAIKHVWKLHSIIRCYSDRVVALFHNQHFNSLFFNFLLDMNCYTLYKSQWKSKATLCYMFCGQFPFLILNGHHAITLKNDR